MYLIIGAAVLLLAFTTLIRGERTDDTEWGKATYTRFDDGWVFNVLVVAEFVTGFHFIYKHFAE